MCTCGPMTDDQVATLRKALEHVVAHPDEWDQQRWGLRRLGATCRTSFCLAGHVAVTVAGAVPSWRPSDLGDSLMMDRVRVVDADGAVVVLPVSEYARDALGLCDDAGVNLFSGSNGLRRLAELAYLYSDGRVGVLDALPPPTEDDVDLEAVDRADRWAHFCSLRVSYERLCLRAPSGRTWSLPSFAAFLDERVGRGRRVAS